MTAAQHRPRVYGDCEREGLGTAANPCPFVSCKHHVALDIDPRTGAVTLHHDPDAFGALEATCALVVAAEGEHTLEQVGALLACTRERVRQIEERALRKLAPFAEGHR